MKVLFNSKLKIAGIGLVPWTRLGPERWFENYAIASLYGWDISLEDAPTVHAFADTSKSIDLPKLNSQSMLNDEAFQQMLIDELPGYSFLTYKPVSVPKKLQQAGIKFLSTDTTLARKLENKAQFRTMFAAKGIRFPQYSIYKTSDASNRPDFLKTILSNRQEVILQDAELSGGKGTYLVRDLQSLDYALDSIAAIGGSDSLVVSEKIDNPHERTVQCVVTRHGVFVGPLQKQIIADELLANLSVADGDKFCGAEISKNDAFAGSYDQIKKSAEIIGKELQELGYKGIFGIDTLVNDSGDVYILEVNPRITGVTPLLTMLYRPEQDIPFYLLHILELMDEDYQIIDSDIDTDIAEGSLLMLHGQHTSTSHITHSPKSGIYSSALDYIQPSLRFTSTSEQILVQQYTPTDFKVKPGGRVMSIFINRPVMNADDTLSSETKKLVGSLSDMVKLEQI